MLSKGIIVRIAMGFWCLPKALLVLLLVLLLVGREGIVS